MLLLPAACIKLNGGGALARALFAPANVSIIACTTAIPFPNLLFCPTIFAIEPKAFVIFCSFAFANFLSISIFFSASC